METYIKRYEGRWVGDYTVHSPATGYTETFPVEQQYWWSEGALRGVSVAQRKDGMMSSRSVTYVDGNRLISEVKHFPVEDEEEKFIGVLHEGGLVWISADIGRTDDYQMRETLEEEDGQLILRTEGFDTYLYQDEPAQIIYKGELTLVEESETR